MGLQLTRDCTAIENAYVTTCSATVAPVQQSRVSYDKSRLTQRPTSIPNSFTPQTFVLCAGAHNRREGY